VTLKQQATALYQGLAVVIAGVLAFLAWVLERFEEAKQRALGSLALAEQGSTGHAMSLDRLANAETALAYKRLAFAKAMHDWLVTGSLWEGIDSPLAELVERELFRSIAEQLELEPNRLLNNVLYYVQESAIAAGSPPRRAGLSAPARGA